MKNPSQAHLMLKPSDLSNCLTILIAVKLFPLNRIQKVSNCFKELLKNSRSVSFGKYAGCFLNADNQGKLRMLANLEYHIETLK